MEVQTLDNELSAAMDYHSNVDTSRPFRSVKEAVAIFGEKFLAGEICAPKPFNFPKQETPYYSPSPRESRETSWKYSPSPSPGKSSDHSNDHILVDALKKLEVELEETKMELKLLKERECETEVALASLNAELHKNMSKLAQAEADAAGKAVALRSKSYGEIEEVETKEEKKRDLFKRMESTSSTLAEILSIGENEGFFGGRKREKKVMKKKPIIPLVGDLFSRKKGSSTTLHNPLYAYSLN